MHHTDNCHFLTCTDKSRQIDIKGRNGERSHRHCGVPKLIPQKRDTENTRRNFGIILIALVRINPTKEKHAVGLLLLQTCVLCSPTHCLFSLINDFSISSYSSRLISSNRNSPTCLCAKSCQYQKARCYFVAHSSSSKNNPPFNMCSITPLSNLCFTTQSNEGRTQFLTSQWYIYASTSDIVCLCCAE